MAQQPMAEEQGRRHCLGGLLRGVGRPHAAPGGGNGAAAAGAGGIGDVEAAAGWDGPNGESCGRLPCG